MSTPWSMKSLMNVNVVGAGEPQHDEQEAMLRHDMVNCITSMHMQIELLRRRTVLTDTQSGMLVEYIHRMEQLMQDWRTHCGSKPPRRDTVFNLTDILAGIIEGNRAYADLHDQAIALDIEAAPAIMTGDPGQIQRALDNLVSNAMKYTPMGGVIFISLAVEDGKAVISIMDTGIGIPTNELPHIYTPFFRAENAVARQIPGTGLGLAQVKEAVEQHGGSIHVRSKVGSGSGTQVNVYLPLKIERSASVI